MVHYTTCFKNKVVYLNCDNPNHSNFWVYFEKNFERLGLKRLVSTHYLENFSSYRRDMFVDVNGHVTIEETPLINDGDFRSDECVAIMKQSDIIVTNPPFSLFIELMDLLINLKKDFIILGSQNNVAYKDVFNYIIGEKLWLGNYSGSMSFEVPNNPDYTVKKDFTVNEDTGKTYRKFGNICWYTNLDYPNRYRDLELCEAYTPDKYPKYDNYNAIEVGKVKDIPKDYFETMGVPITFLAVHNPEQFEIMGFTSGRKEYVHPTKRYINAKQVKRDGTIVNGSKINTRATLLLESVPKDKTYYLADNAGKPLRMMYARILIRRK